MLVLAASGALTWLARIVPKSVVRGIQFGLGLQLASISLQNYVRAESTTGYFLAGVAFVVVVLLLGNRRLPAALPVVALGLAFAAYRLDPSSLAASVGLHLPTPHVPQLSDIATGFLLLALPQIPLSLGNSVLATRQLAHDLFPERNLTIRKIGITYAIMNLISPWLGGIPTCHGSGGMAGHYAFGGRTGGSVIIYGLIFVALGLFFGPGFDHVVKSFPLPILGVLQKQRNLAGDENMSNDSRKSVVSDEHGRIIEYHTTEYFDDGSSKTTHQEVVRGDGGIVDILCGPSPGRITGETYHSPDGTSEHYKR